MVIPTTHGKLALIGSGELSDSMAEVHRLLMGQLGEPVRPVFVDTLAGFELNIDGINQKAISYFKRNFGLELALARFRSAKDSADTVAAAVTAIQRANYIFAGPGSPSYGIRTWQESRVWQAILERWRAGAMLVFASAAAITAGAQSIPVYEIYKVGEDAHWIDGLNLLHDIGITAAIVPHWNNNSGDQHDTRFCFMGAPRLSQLEAQLPADSKLIGIDEYTALLINGAAHRADVFGVGAVTIRGGGLETQFRKGQVIDFDHLSLKPAAALEPMNVEPESAAIGENTLDSEVERVRIAAREAIEAQNLQTAVDNLFALSLIAGAGLEQSNFGRADQAVQALQTLLPLLKAAEPTQISATVEAEAGLIELLIAARAELRKAKQWAAADDLRKRLTELQYVLSDTPQGTIWQHTAS